MTLRLQGNVRRQLALDELDPAAVNGLDAARENAMKLALELVSVAADVKEPPDE